MLISLICRFKYLPNHDDKITVKPLLSGHLQGLPKVGGGGCFIEGVRLIEVLKIAQCLLTINIQQLLFTVIKFYVVKEAVLYFDLCKTLRRTLIADDNHTAWYWPNLQFLTAKCIDLSLILDYSTYFMDVIQYYSVLSIQSGVYLMEVFNYRNLFQCPRPLKVAP